MQPPIVKGLPILGSAIDLSKDILKFLGKEYENQGDSFIFNLPGRRIFTTRSAEVAQHILQKNNKNYRKDYGANKLKMALGNGLLTNEGESWFKQRRLAQPAFYKKRLESFFDTMQQFTLSHIEPWKNKSSQTIFIDAEMMQLTSKIVVETLLGSDITKNLTGIQSYIYDIQSYLVKIIRNPVYEWFSAYNGDKKQFENIIQKFDTILYDVIQKKKKSDSNNDLLSMLIEARDVDTGEAMSDVQLRDELLTIYVAGHETSGYAIAWSIYNICKHPESYQKVKDELKLVMPNGVLTMENFGQLKYLRAVIDESLRLYPTAYIVGRESKEKDEIDGLEIPKDIMTLISVYHLHRNPKYWKQPNNFVPERFLDKAHPLANSDAYFPFGAGPRMCIGFYFALMEITVVLANLFYHFDLKLVENQTIEFEPLVTLKPKNGIQVEITNAK
ncbi:MAG: cytochrome P450 [Saprospirales bacterium]|nr:cytochrome P450 [Saprospirales bacterium]